MRYLILVYSDCILINLSNVSRFDPDFFIGFSLLDDYSFDRLLKPKYNTNKCNLINTIKYHVSYTDGKISVRITIFLFENVALMTKGLQERKQLVSGTSVEKYLLKINSSNLI